MESYIESFCKGLINRGKEPARIEEVMTPGHPVLAVVEALAVAMDYDSLSNDQDRRLLHYLATHLKKITSSKDRSEWQARAFEITAMTLDGELSPSKKQQAAMLAIFSVEGATVSKASLEELVAWIPDQGNVAVDLKGDVARVETRFRTVFSVRYPHLRRFFEAYAQDGQHGNTDWGEIGALRHEREE